MDADVKRAKAQKELDQLTALIFRWRWPAVILIACDLAGSIWQIYSKFPQWSHLVTLKSVMAGTLYQSIGPDVGSIISLSFFLLVVWNEVTRHRSLLAQAELKHITPSPDGWPPAPRI